MAFWENFRGMLTQTVTIAPTTGFNKNGIATHGTAVSYPARIMGATRRFFDSNGKEIQAQYEIVVGTTNNVSVHDKLTLPSPFEPTNPPIRGVEEAQDETGFSHVVVFV